MVAPNGLSREQAYLTSVANQPKDIDPDRIYEVGHEFRRESHQKCSAVQSSHCLEYNV